MPEGRRPRGVTPRPRSGAAAESTRLRRAGTAERSYPAEVRGCGREEIPTPEARGGDERSYPASEVRGGGREELLNAPKPEANGSRGEEQPQDRDQGRWPGGPTPRPRSRGCAGAGGPRRAIPH